MGMTLYTGTAPLEGVYSKNRNYEGYFSCKDLQFEHACNLLFIVRSLKLSRKKLFDIGSKGILRFLKESRYKAFLDLNYKIKN